jgi:AAA family ATP:ADP antiporter
VTLIGRFLPERHQLYKALWLGAILLSITGSYTLVKVARDALFLSQIPARALPLVFVLVGVVTLAVAWAYGRATHRLSPLRALTVTALGAALVLAMFGIAFPSGHRWLPFAFYVWVNVYGLLLTSQFWTFTNSISDPREAKHIFGIVGGGGILGGLLGGLGAARFGETVPLEWLAWAGAGLLVLMVVTVEFAVSQGRVRRSEETVSAAPPQPLRKVSYVRWLALATLCSVVVTGLVDYQFKVVVQERYSTAPALASFFGRFFIAINVAALALQLVATRWLLQRVGAAPMAAVLPVGLAAGAAATLAAPGLGAVLGTRLWDQILRFSLNKSTHEMFYFPLDPGLRRRAKAFIEAGIERFADGLAGLLILLAGLLLDTRPETLSAIVLGLVVLWIFSWARLRRGYVSELGRSLRRMNVDPKGNTVSLRERGVVKELVRTLDSPYERVVLRALDMLEEVGAGPLIEARVEKLLAHRSPRVRARALERAAEHPTGDLRAALEAAIRDPDPMVRVQALRAFCALGEGPALETLEAFTREPDAGVRGTALACAVQFAGEPDLPRVRALLAARLEGADPVERVLAAEALGARPAPSPLHDLLPPLFEDADLEVRRAAYRAAGRAGLREHAALLIRALGARDTERAATEGLLAFGEGAVGTLGDWLGDPRVAVEVRRAIPRVLRDVPTANAVVALFRVRDREDVVLRYRALKAMNRIRAANPDLVFPADLVAEDLDTDVKDFLVADLHAESQRAAAGPAERFLLRVLRERRQQAFNRVFRRLALVHPPRPLFAAYHGLQSSLPRVRGSAVEYLENALTAEQRERVMPLLPESPPEARVALARSAYRLEPLDEERSLVELLDSEDPWIRSCALYVAGRRRARALLARVAAGLEARDARVRETAGWARLAIEAA